MRERGKAIETGFNDLSMFDFNYSASSEFPCRKHPSSSSVGICAFCLKDRLISLVCSDCGEHRFSSCSCSGSFCNNDDQILEVGSVGRVSFLIENERSNETQNNSPFQSISNPVNDQNLQIGLKRSSSSCVEAKKTGGGGGGFGKIGRFFRKKVGKDEIKDSNSVLDYVVPVSRSRSLCSFRGGGIRDTTSTTAEDMMSTSDFTFSSAKISDVNGGSMMESARISCFSSETEPRKSGFMVSEDSGFIDLKLDLSSSSSADQYNYSMLRNSDLYMAGVENGSSGGLGGGLYRMGEMKTEKNKKKRHKVWKWILRHNPNWNKNSPKERDRSMN